MARRSVVHLRRLVRLLIRWRRLRHGVPGMLRLLRLRLMAHAGVTAHTPAGGVFHGLMTHGRVVGRLPHGCMLHGCMIGSCRHGMIAMAITTDR